MKKMQCIIFIVIVICFNKNLMDTNRSVDGKSVSIIWKLEKQVIEEGYDWSIKIYLN